MVRSALNPARFPKRPPMPQISRPTIHLSLLVTPPSDAARDQICVDERVKAALCRACQGPRTRPHTFTTPPAKDKFENLEPCGFTARCALWTASLRSPRSLRDPARRAR